MHRISPLFHCLWLFPVAVHFIFRCFSKRRLCKLLQFRERNNWRNRRYKFCYCQGDCGSRCRVGCLLISMSVVCSQASPVSISKYPWAGDTEPRVAFDASIRVQANLTRRYRKSAYTCMNGWMMLVECFECSVRARKDSMSIIHNTCFFYTLQYNVT